MAAPYVIFGVPEGFPRIADHLNRVGFEARQDSEIEQESCAPNMLGWRTWIIVFPNGQSTYLLECKEPEPEIFFNLYGFKDGKQFRIEILKAGAIEHWNGIDMDAGGFWRRRYFRNYRRRLGYPASTTEESNKRVKSNG